MGGVFIFYSLPEGRPANAVCVCCDIKSTHCWVVNFRQLAITLYRPLHGKFARLLETQSALFELQIS